MAYGIFRIDKDKTKSGGNTHGWQVRVGMNLKRGYHSKLFSDGVHGGKVGARVAASGYLDSYLAEHPEFNFRYDQHAPVWEHGFNENGTLHGQNKSGRNGVCRSRTNMRHDKTRFRYFWMASYTIDRFGKTKVNRNMKFFIDDWGEREAKRRAIAFRELWEEAALQGVRAVVAFFDAWHDGFIEL